MFEITEFAEAKITVQNRTEKHGDEDVPAVTLGFEMVAANTMLDLLCPGLRHALYKAVEGQEQLPGVEPATPVLRSNVIDIVKLTTAHEGWRLLIDDGIDETTPMEFKAGKIDKFTVEPKQGGSVVERFKYGTSDVDADRLGKLGMHNGQSVWIKVLKPEKVEPAIDGSVEAFEKDHPGQGSLLNDTAGTGDDGLGGFDDDMARGGDAGITEGAGAGQASGSVCDSAQVGKSEARGENWPFPTGGAKSDEQVAAEREQAEIEAGMRQSIQKAGVSPKGARRGRKAVAGAVE